MDAGHVNGHLVRVRAQGMSDRGGRASQSEGENSVVELLFVGLLYRVGVC